MVTGTAAERRQILAKADSEDILLTSYDLLKRDISEYEGYKFRCEIIDEAQYIKNANTQAAKAVKRGSGRLQAGSYRDSGGKPPE